LLAKLNAIRFSPNANVCSKLSIIEFILML
jgi:hypothetical protein